MQGWFRKPPGSSGERGIAYALGIFAELVGQPLPRPGTLLPTGAVKARAEGPRRLGRLRP